MDWGQVASVGLLPALGHWLPQYWIAEGPYVSGVFIYPRLIKYDDHSLLKGVVRKLAFPAGSPVIGKESRDRELFPRHSVRFPSGMADARRQSCHLEIDASRASRCPDRALCKHRRSCVRAAKYFGPVRITPGPIVLFCEAVVACLLAIPYYGRYFPAGRRCLPFFLRSLSHKR